MRRQRQILDDIEDGEEQNSSDDSARSYQEKYGFVTVSKAQNNQNDSSEDDIGPQRRRGRTQQKYDSEDSDKSVDVQIDEFLLEKQKIGANIMYKVMDLDQDEHWLTIKQIDRIVTKSGDADLQANFLEHLCKGEKGYKQLLGKEFVSLKRGKNTQNYNSQKKQQVELQPHEYGRGARRQTRVQKTFHEDYAQIYDTPDEDCSDPDSRRKRQSKASNKQQQNVQSSPQEKKRSQKVAQKETSKQQNHSHQQVLNAPDGNLDEHQPRLVRSLHGCKPSSKYPETLCTVEWYKDFERGCMPKASQVTYAEMRRKYPQLLCEYFERRIVFE